LILKDDEIDQHREAINKKVNDEDYTKLVSKAKLLEGQNFELNEKVQDLEAFIKTLEKKGKSHEQEKQRLLDNLNQVTDDQGLQQQSIEQTHTQHEEEIKMYIKKLDELNVACKQNETKITKLKSEIGAKNRQIDDTNAQMSFSKTDDDDKFKDLKEEHSQTITNLMSEIQVKDDDLTKLHQDYKNLELIMNERISKTEKMAEQKLSKVEKDFMKEYKSIVKENEGI
jgi:chromosome segregation ATPase